MAGTEPPSPRVMSASRDAGARRVTIQRALPYVHADCFERTDPAVVPAWTFLSQLV